MMSPGGQFGLTPTANVSEAAAAAAEAEELALSKASGRQLPSVPRTKPAPQLSGGGHSGRLHAHPPLGQRVWPAGQGAKEAGRHMSAAATQRRSGQRTGA